MMTLRYISRRWLVSVFLAVLLGGFALPAPAVHAATTLHVTSCADDGGAATLRGMIGAAAAGDTIAFDKDCTIALTQGTLSLTQNMSIDGTGHTVIVDGGCTGCNPGGVPSGGVQVFLVNSGVTASLSTLTIQHGNEAPFLGGGIENDGTLTVDDAKLSSAVNSDFAGVQNFFHPATGTGFASALATQLDPLTDSTQGAFSIELKGMSDGVKSFQDQIDNYEIYLATQKTLLTQQYTQVDLALRQLPLLQQQINSELNFQGNSNSKNG